ncbi:MAG: hypothetical protein LBB21_01590 [Holosporaceae bacterium]|nr:hypothetical protein [Holosporaceae bacterium]
MISNVFSKSCNSILCAFVLFSSASAMDVCSKVVFFGDPDIKSSFFCSFRKGYGEVQRLDCYSKKFELKDRHINIMFFDTNSSVKYRDLSARYCLRDADFVVIPFMWNATAAPAVGFQKLNNDYLAFVRQFGYNDSQIILLVPEGELNAALIECDSNNFRCCVVAADGASESVIVDYIDRNLVEKDRYSGTVSIDDSPKNSNGCC